MRLPSYFPLLASIGVLSSTLSGQWLNLPTPGLPRGPAGRPVLFAAAPRTTDGHPDLSGLWRRSLAFGYNVMPDIKDEEIAPWARALTESHLESLGQDSPSILCLPLGPAYSNSPLEARIVQTPNLIAMLHPDLTYRQIFMDGRKLEQEPNPAWMGYSVGRWDGDTLVVESNGYNDRTWLDAMGHPHSESLRITERFTRSTVGRMQLQITFEDPKAYAKAWTVNVDMFLAADTEMLEFVCNENERDRRHHVGTASELRSSAVKMSSGELTKYAGRYAIGPQQIEVIVAGSELSIRVFGAAVPLIPLSDTMFSSYVGPITFTKDAAGAIQGMTVDLGGGETTAARVK